MKIERKTAEQILAALNKAQNILIISHRNPDADTIGSNLALRLFLEQKGKTVTSACVSEVAPICSFLPHSTEFVTDFKVSSFDLFISVDCGSTSQANFPDSKPELLKGKIPFINIDHHPSNNNFGSINLVADMAASTTIIVYNLFKIWKAEITTDMATCLLYGLYYDTGSFMHSNTDAEVYETAAALLELGASRNLIIENLYKNQTEEKFKILGMVLAGTQLSESFVAISAIREEDLNSCNAKIQDVSGAIDYLSMVKGSKFAALLTEDSEGNIRGSLRTRRNDLNVSEIAESLGGGGHKKASGFTIKGRLQREIHWSVKPNSDTLGP